MPHDQPHDAAAPEENTEPQAAATEKTTEPKTLRDFGIAAALLGQKGLIGAVRLLLPLMEEFARSGKADELATGRKSRSLSQSEREVLKVAAAKFAYEMIEYASRKYPVEGGDRYVATRDDRGQYPQISTAHLFSLATLIGESLSSVLARVAEPSQRRIEDTSPHEVPVQPILLTSVGANEYRLIDRPLTPLEIRRAAGRQRQLNLRTRG